MILELFQETDIVFIQQTHVVNFIFKQSNTLQSHSKCESRILIRVNTAHLQYMGVYHTASQNLYPARTLAEPAARTAAFETGHIHLGAGLGKWEVVGAELHLCLRPEQLSGEFSQRSLQVRKGNIPVNHKALNLMEGGGMGGIHLIGTEHAARRNHADGKPALLHGTHLYR